jgi:hypothetical protein
MMPLPTIDILRRAFLAVTMMASLAPAALAADCNEAILQEVVDQANDDLAKPSVNLALVRAQQDFAQDQDFDNDSDAVYMAAAANVIEVERHLKAGYVDQACDQYERSQRLFELLRSAE